MHELIFRINNIRVILNSNSSNVIEIIRYVIGMSSCEVKYDLQVEIEIFSKREVYEISLTINGNIIINDICDDDHWLDFFLELILYIQKTCCDSQISFHASSILYKNNLFAFFNKSGSGKTTFLLNCLWNLKESYFFSDDILTYDRVSNKFYGFPCALHLKEGTINVFKERINSYLGPYYKNETLPYWFHDPCVSERKKYEVELDKLEGIFFIHIKYGSNQDNTYFDTVKGIEKMCLLIENCYQINSKDGKSINEGLSEIAGKVVMNKLVYCNIREGIDKIELLSDLSS